MFECGVWNAECGAKGRYAVNARVSDKRDGTLLIPRRSMSGLRARTKRFAIAIFKLCDSLPDTPSCKVVRKQLARSASSVGANYRAACHARSKAEFLSKMSIAEEEADETEYWLELLEGVSSIPEEQVERFQDEAHQITSMVIASIKTARRRQRADSGE